MVCLASGGSVLAGNAGAVEGVEMPACRDDSVVAPKTHINATSDRIEAEARTSARSLRAEGEAIQAHSHELAWIASLRSQ